MTSLVKTTVMCRVCTIGGRQLVPFAQFDTERKTYQLAEAISAIGGVRVANDDGLPQYCCFRCLREVESAYKIHRLCQETDRKLREMFRGPLRLTSLVVVKPDVPLEVAVEVKKENEEEFESEELPFKEETEESRLQDTVDIKQEIEEMQTFNEANENPEERVKNEKPFPKLPGHVMEVVELESQDEDEAQEPLLNHEEPESEEDADEESRQADESVDVKSRICCSCSKLFNSPEELIAHSQEVHYPKRSHPNEIRPYVCGICYKCLPNKNDLEDHERQFREDLEKFLCRKCGKAFYCVKRFNIHRSSHGPVLSRCHMCPFVSHRANAARGHIGRHCLPDGTFKCLVCGRCYNSPTALSKHSALHPRKIPMRCPHCPRMFNNKMWLRKHINLHEALGKMVQSSIQERRNK
uniref:Putative c2h2-type zn-finger protein n=1 Tax=Culex tarsalis TaxID=7177 RepID=A0A1Q3EZD6_CULTA